MRPVLANNGKDLDKDKIQLGDRFGEQPFHLCSSRPALRRSYGAAGTAATTSVPDLPLNA